jgi:hypothetical protein|tara:strand:+ start:17448 stop:17699 length:252 start_codon:yes stop_codon:yes gene_type:complete
MGLVCVIDSRLLFDPGALSSSAPLGVYPRRLHPDRFARKTLYAAQHGVLARGAPWIDPLVRGTQPPEAARGRGHNDGDSMMIE